MKLKDFMFAANEKAKQYNMEDWTIADVVIEEEETITVEATDGTDVIFFKGIYEEGNLIDLEMYEA